MIFTSSPSLTISDFEQFSGSSNFREEAIIGRSFFGKPRLKAIGSLSFQRYSGETASIVTAFKKVVAQKYGDEIANFVFPQHHLETALARGLTKKTIAAVLKKASMLEEADFVSYREALKSKHEFAFTVVKKLKATPCYEAAQKKYEAIQKELKDFDNELAHFEFNLTSSDQSSKNLQLYFQEKLHDVDALAHNMVALSDVAEKIKDVFGTTDLSQEMLEIFVEHDEVMTQLKKDINQMGRPSALEALKAFDENSLDPLLKIIKKTGEVLASFSAYFHEGNAAHYFSLNQRGEIIIQDPAEPRSASTQQAQERAAHVFFDTLKSYYDARFINKLRPKETHNQPLTVGDAEEIFKKIDECFTKLGAFFQRQPFLFTKEYLDEVHAHPELAPQVVRDYQALNAEGRTLLLSAQRALDTAFIGLGHYASSSTYALIAGSHATALGILCGASGALGVAAVIGAAVGYLVMRGHHHGQEQLQAAGLSAVLTVEGTLGEIAATLISPALPGGGIVLDFARDFIMSNLISGGAGAAIDANSIVNASLNAFAGGSVSGALAAEEENQDTATINSETASPRSERDQTSAPHDGNIDLQDEVSLEARLGFKQALETLMEQFSQLLEATSHIPIDAANADSGLSRSTGINL